MLDSKVDKDNSYKIYLHQYFITGQENSSRKGDVQRFCAPAAENVARDEGGMGFTM